MKNLLLSFVILFLSYCSLSAREKAQVAYLEETELVSVVSYLAGIPGYDWDENEVLPEYLTEVDRVFAAFRQHKAVTFAADSLLDSGFAWHFPVTLALRFKLVEGRIVYKQDLEPNFDDYYENISPEHEATFLVLLQDFYDHTNFHQFFVAHQSLYRECKEAMQIVVDSIDFSWYDSFFGPRHDSSFNVYLGILNGPGNYAIQQRSLDGSGSVNAMMGCCSRNKEGYIHYGIYYTLPILVHECNHSYCNPLNEEYWSQLEEKVTEVFMPNREFYKSIAYGSPIFFLNETFVEASVMRYLMSHKVNLEGYTIEDFIKIDEVNKKFVMIRDVINVLQEREDHPELYPTMHDFMPRYVECINNFKQ